MPKIETYADPKTTVAAVEAPKRPPLLKKAGEREVKYPELHVQVCDAETPLTAEAAMRLLGWENERAFAERVKSENPKAREAQLKYGDEWLLKDLEGIKVRCGNNNVAGGATNRDFDERWAYALAQVILNKQYAPDGPNGETIIVGRTGLVISGQHRLIALVLAAQIWGGLGKVGRAQKDHWREIWESEPTIETLVAFGISEEPRSVMTTDNVKPRSPADVFFTSEHFARLTTPGRAECSKMLASAASLFWHRTGAQTVYDKAMTNQALVSLVDCHPKMLKAISVVFNANVERSLSRPEMRLNPGHCSAMLYLMGASATDGERNRFGQVHDYADAEPEKKEKALDMSNWAKAEAFFVALANGNPKLKEVRYRLKTLNENAERPASNREKLAVLAQAWAAWVSGKKVTEEVCRLDYVVNDRGEQALKETPSVSGIDLGEPREAISDEPEYAEEVDREAEKARIRGEQARKLMESRANGKGKKPKADAGANGEDAAAEKGPDDERREFMSIKEEFPGLLLLIRHKTGGLSAYNGDAAKLAEVLEVELKAPKGSAMPRLAVADKDLDETVERLSDAGVAAAIVEKNAEGRWEAAGIGPGDDDRAAVAGEDDGPTGDEE